MVNIEIKDFVYTKRLLQILNNFFLIFFRKKFNVIHSYDWNISKLGRTQGIHELSLVWQSSRKCHSCKETRLKLKRKGYGFSKL